MSDYDPILGQYVTYREVGGVSKPLINCVFDLRGVQNDCPMLIDSGTDDVLLPRYMLDLFDLDESDCDVRRGFTISGYRQVLKGPMFHISVPDLWPGGGFDAHIGFAEWLDERGYGLLGREPAFDHISVRFGHDHGFGYYLKFG